MYYSPGFQSAYIEHKDLGSSTTLFISRHEDFIQ